MMGGLITLGSLALCVVALRRGLMSAVIHFAHTDVTERLEDNVPSGDPMPRATVDVRATR